MSENVPRLCARCESFDVRSLLLAAEAQKCRTSRHSADIVRPGLKSSFLQHDNLSQLRECVEADLCELCNSIWRSYKFTYNVAEDKLQERIEMSHRNVYRIWWRNSIVKHPLRSPGVLRVLKFALLTVKLYQRNVFATASDNRVDAETGSDSHLLARVQATSSDDEQVFELAKGWMLSCERDHASCRNDSRKSFQRPTRLLQIYEETSCGETERDRLMVRLVDDSPFDEPFAALSYCWGDYAPSSLILRKDTESCLYRGVRLSDLPTTLEHTAVTTSRLGLKHLWIDALCIRQDDEEDWARESARMRDVYRGAAVTIEAASANSLNDGFLKNRTSSMPYCRLPWTGVQQQILVQLRPVQDLSEAQLFGTKLYTRGWTFQERLLASRTLSFGTQQVTFECMDGYQQEARLLSQPTTLSKGRDFSKAVLKSIRTADAWYFQLLRFVLKWFGLYPSFRLFNTTFVVEPALIMHMGDAYNPSRTYQELWATLVHLYSQRSLTAQSDRLPAIHGLADEFQHYIDDTYVAGMWKRDLAINLGWMSSTVFRDEGMRNKVVPSLLISERELVDEWPYGIRNDSTSGTPSWSWASVRGPVSLPDGDLRDVSVCTTVLDVEIVSKFADSNGLLSFACVDLQAPFVLIPDPQLHNSIPSGCPFPRLLEEIRLRLKYTGAGAPEFYQQHQQHDGQEFALIKLYQWNRWVNQWALPSVQIMVLESNPDGSFRRLASFAVRNSRSQKDFVQWHMYEDYKSSRLRQRQIPFFEYLRIYHEEIQEGAELAEEVNSTLWKERRIRLT